uniref:Uncharacterized protein n=1 Tax=Onchocerca volvulus TaxID=6282 RepID=A0A8R1TWH1_ONCVO
MKCALYQNICALLKILLLMTCLREKNESAHRGRLAENSFCSDDCSSNCNENTKDFTPQNNEFFITNSINEEHEKQKNGHRCIDQQDNVLVNHEHIPSNALMGAIQLGIANSVGSLASIPKRDLLLQDFDVVHAVSFPSYVLK